MRLSLAELNQAAAPRFVELLEGVYEHSPWIAERAAAKRPFATSAALARALVEVVREAGREAQLDLLCAHPELAGKAAIAGELTADSSREQARAGLAHCTPEEFARLHELNAAYRARFGWPFILAVGGPRGAGLTRGEIIASLERRIANPAAFEFAECLRNVHRIAELRLAARFEETPQAGLKILDWAERLARHSDPGFAERGELTVTYLRAAHQACQQDLAAWMREAGCDEVGVDAVGNVVGVYHGTDRAAPRLLTGSHFDTVRNGGRYDGRLGIFVPLAVVAQLAEAGRRPRAGIEIVAFAEEEGQRYAASFLASSALVGEFDPAWLALADEDGVTMANAMQAAGLPAAMPAIEALARDPAHYAGFVEVHIEQGPVLDALDLPLGAVSSINGSVRYRGEIVGMASHAGTTPMGARADAAAAAAEIVLAVERLAAERPQSVGTVGVLEVPAGSVNVVPGRCRFSLDLRAPVDALRDELEAAVLAEAEVICARRGVSLKLERNMQVAAAPADPAWRARWEAAIAALGLPVHVMPSGAGHDAMKIAARLPQAMLFVRGGNAGISHNPLETITAHDAELAVRAFALLLDGLEAKS